MSCVVPGDGNTREQQAEQIGPLGGELVEGERGSGNFGMNGEKAETVFERQLQQLLDRADAARGGSRD